MAARELNRQNQIAPELALAQGPVPTGQLDGGATDGAALLAAYDAHLQLLENRPKTTAGTYRSHVKGFLRYLATNYPSVALCEVTSSRCARGSFTRPTGGQLQLPGRPNCLLSAASTGP